jgi:hypothetical protein
MAETETEKHVAELRKFASVLNALAVGEDPQPVYEVMSDALVWPDELPTDPPIAANELWPLRFVWHYRTSLILAAPRDTCQTYWIAGQRLFPKWPGFDPRRQSTGLRPIYEALKQQCEDSWRAFLTRVDGLPPLQG